MEISQNFVAFSEYMNFKVHHYLCGSKFSFLVMQWNKKNYFVFSENQSIKMSTAWQRNLRRSEGTSNLPRAIGIKNQNKNNVGVQARGQFSLVSGLCHSEISFWFWIEVIIFFYQKCQNLIWELGYNDSHLTILLCWKILRLYSKVIKFESLCSTCQLNFDFF